MANYKNINVSNMRTALNALKKNLDSSKLKGEMSSLASNSVWEASAKRNLIDALNKQLDKNYQNVKDKIDKYLNVCTYIEKWQELNSENKKYEQQMNSAKDKIYYWTTDYKTNADGEKEKYTYQAYSSFWDNKYNEYRRLIADNKKDMKNYESKIENNL